MNYSMNTKRIISVIIVVVLIMSVLPSPALGAEGCSVDVTTELFGNISESSSVSFDAKIVSPHSGVVSLVFKAVDEYGAVCDRETKTVQVTGGSSANVAVTLDTGAYGVFVLETEVYSDGVLVHTDTTDFSVMKTTTKVNDEVGIHMLFQNDSDHRKYLQDIAELYEKCGYSTVREGWPWKEVERTAGSFKLNTLMKNQMTLFTQNPDKDILLTLGYGSSLHTGSDTNPAKTETELKAWYDYCYNLALLTKGEPVSFEVYNEYDMVGTTAEYYELLKNAYTAVKAANPNAKVYGMVTSWTAEWWISEVLDMGGGAYLDGISIHPYAWSQSPEEFGSMDGIASVRKLMNDKGLSDKELVVTEIGWYKMVGREKQASYHVRFLALNKVRDLLDKTIYFRYARSLATENNEEFGFLENANADVPFSAFPVFIAMSNYNSIMTDAVYTKTVTDNTYMYKLDNGKNCIMMWDDDRRQISLDLGVNSVTLTDMYGNEQTVYGTDGKYSFIASSNVSYISGSFTDAAVCESVVAPDKCVAVNYNKDYDVITVKNSEDKTVEIISSQNVMAYTRTNTSGECEIVTSCHGMDKGYVYIKVISGNNCCFAGRAEVQGRGGDSFLVYDSGYDEFDLKYMHGIGIEEYDGEEVISAFSTADSETERAIISRPFRIDAGGAVSVSADIFFNGSTDMQILAEGDGVSVPLIGCGIEGKFGYGSDLAYEKELSYQTGRWYNLECILNLDAKTAHYYVDGEYLGEMGNVSFPTEIKQVSIPIETTDNVKTYIKDFRVKRYSAGSLMIEEAVPAADNSYVDVKFTGALAPDTDLSVLGICDVNSGKLLSVSRIEKLTASDYRIILTEPIKSGGLYAAVVNGLLYGAENIVFDGNEFVFNANKIDNHPKVKGVYSIGDKMRTHLNGFCPTGDILIELSEAAAQHGEVTLSKGEESVEISYSFSPDGRYIIVTPDEKMENGETYNLKLSGFKNTVGESFEDYSMSFTVSEGYMYGIENVSGSALSGDGYIEYFSDGFEDYGIMSAEYPKDSYTFTGENWSWASNIGGPWEGLGAQVVSANGGKALKLVNWGTDGIAASKLTANIGEKLDSGVVDVYFDAAVYNPEDNEALNYLEVYLCGNKNMPVMKIFGNTIKGYINGSWSEIELAEIKNNDIKEFDKCRITIDFDEGILAIAVFSDGEYKTLMRTNLLGSEGEAILESGFGSVMFSQYRHNDSTSVLDANTAGVVDNVVIYRRDEANRLSILKNGKGVLRGDISPGDTLTFRAEINNRDDRSESYLMFIAYYSDGMLVKAEMKDVDVTASETGIITRDFDSVVPDAEKIEIKCMLFSDSTKISPEAEMVYK